MKPESTSVRYIRLLAQFPEDGTPLFTAQDEPKEDVAAFAELLRAGYIDGCTVDDEVGRVFAIANMTLTVPGRHYLSELRKKEALNTSVGLIAEHRWSFYRWIFSAVGGGVIGYFIRYYTE